MQRPDRRSRPGSGSAMRRSRLGRLRPARARDLPGRQRRRSDRGRAGPRLAARHARDRRRGHGLDLPAVYTADADRAAEGASPARSTCSSSGCSAVASMLMVRAPAVLHLHDRGLLLRLDPPAAAARRSSAIAATSILVNTLIAGPARRAARPGRSTSRSSPSRRIVPSARGRVISEKVAEQNEERRAALARLEVALESRTPACTPSSLDAGPRGGRARRARADGSRDPRHDRPGADRHRHPARGGRAQARGPAGRPRSAP